MKKIYLVDVSSLFFRSFYAIRNLKSSKGLPTNALYGLLASVTKLLKESKPDGIAFCFDLPEAGFRNEIFPDYKANRDETPEDLAVQIPYIKKLTQALSVAAYEMSGYEADDIIGSLAKKFKRQGLEVVIVSSDKDFAQLVEPGVLLYDPAKDLFTDTEGVRGKFGINPSQMIDYLALVGDASDNVPGVSGIGPKGAQKLLTEFGTLDGIYQNLDQIKNEKLREKLAAQKDQAYLSQKLVTIVCDLDVKAELEDIKLKPVNRSILVPLLEELEFKALLQRLLGAETVKPSAVAQPEAVKEATEAPSTPVDAIVTASTTDLDKAFQKDENHDLWLDVTSHGIALSVGGIFFRFEGSTENLRGWLEEAYEKRSYKISGYDTKEIAHQLRLPSRVFRTIGKDVLLEAYCLGTEDDFSLAALGKKMTGRLLPEFPRPEERLRYVQDISRGLAAKLQEGSTIKVLETIEQPLAPVLYKMEEAGILLDSDRLKKQSVKLVQETQILEKEIYQLVGSEFNIGSPKQLGQILFTKLGLPVIRKTKTGLSTDSDVLEKLRGLHPVATKILEWRELSKLRSTYVDALPQMVNPQTNRVHTYYNQAVTSTGRLSSTHPNLQNIPIRTERGQQLREGFIAPDGFMLLSADYSQVELRILAHITRDPALSRAFEYDIDIHSATASEVFGVALADVTADQRRSAKAINFGIVYGMSEFGLAESLGIDRRMAADFIDRYFSKYPGVKQYMQETVMEGKHDGYVKTIFGRRRFYPGLNSSNQRIRQNAERAAINMPIQGAAADIIKLAMIQVDYKLPEFSKRARMLLQVHDELVFEVPREEADELKIKVAEWMEKTTQLSVPLKVTVGVGPTWGSAH